MDSLISGKNMSPQGVVPSIALCNPKYARNVSMVIRLASCYGFKQVWYSGDRVSIDEPEKNIDCPPSFTGSRKKKPRLPREERMKGYDSVELRQFDRFFDHFVDCVPIAVELRPGAQMLHHFEHPQNALYVFGPEDGGLTSEIVRHCHQFVVVPTHHCLNLATAVSTILWDRRYKELMNGDVEDIPMDMVLKEKRGFACSA